MLKEIAMQTLEERVAYLEGQVSEHGHTLVDIRDSIRDLERRFDARFRSARATFRRLVSTSSIAGFEGLDDKVARHFTWLVGIQVTTLVAILGALLARA
jgi:hypothetical protein